MIRIDRTLPAPTRLVEDGTRQTELDCAAYDESPEEHKSGSKQFPNRTYYNYQDVKYVLMSIHNGKCCYCEAKHGSGDLQVEHFRPKRSVRQTPEGRKEYPGYYWLRYCWDNLFLACPTCNRKKSDNFPLENPVGRARCHHDDLTKERELLVNPTEDNPRDHVRFFDDRPLSFDRTGPTDHNRARSTPLRSYRGEDVLHQTAQGQHRHPQGRMHAGLARL